MVMKSQACEPCAKRKVRCDKGEPCSNCKRRKQDSCVYSEASPADKVKRLEALVRSLGGDPESDSHDARTPNKTSSTSSMSRGLHQHDTPRAASLTTDRDRDSVIVKEDGQSFYLESRAWHGWLRNDEDDSTDRDIITKNPFSARNNPHALQSILCSKPSIDLAAKHPARKHASILWNTFSERVNPIVRISFSWVLHDLRSASIDPELRKQLSNAEHAFVYALYLMSIVSLPEEDCKRELHQPKSFLLSEYQMLCEEALCRTNIFCVTDIIVLKALTLYIMAGIDRLGTQSLWTLMGMMIRSAEKLGLHRDGALLGLSPLETEERRRLWWHLQHLDLVLAVRSGSTSLTLMASWDAKLPLNIEDEDINADMRDFPEERKGTTSASYCLFTYWVIEQQRIFSYSANGQAESSSNRSISHPLRGSLIDHLEEGLNKKFLQYCDPIKPLDALLQLVARALICGMRLRASYPSVYSEHRSQISEEVRSALLAGCIQSLEYNIATQSHRSLKCFNWLTKGLFPWHAFMCILVELSHQNDTSKTQQIWTLLSDLYSANPMLSQLSEDRRSAHAAGLVVAAWKARERQSTPDELPPKPKFVTMLETQNPSARAGVTQTSGTASSQQTGVRQGPEPIAPETFPTEQDVGAIFDLDLQDIDWSFWSSID